MEYNEEDLVGIYSALKAASVEIYNALKSGYGLHLAEQINETGDQQIGLDIFADNSFVEALSNVNGVRSIMSEERSGLINVNKGEFTVALDPLDGSKSALYGVPCGAIFGLFKGIEGVSSFSGTNLIGSGFFVFGINLEMYVASCSGVQVSTYDPVSQHWKDFRKLPVMSSANVFAINVSGIDAWDQGLREYYLGLHRADGPLKPPKGRWFASLVLDVKRLILQGGVFAYPANSQKGYENGHLRLVYEGIPMAFLVEKLGGASSDGHHSLLEKSPKDLHEKTPVFLGEVTKIDAIEHAIAVGA